MFESELKTISFNPKAFKQTETFKNLHICVVTKQTSFLYHILESEIEIVTVFDNRQDPGKLKKEIKSRFL